MYKTKILFLFCIFLILPSVHAFLATQCEFNTLQPTWEVVLELSSDDGITATNSHAALPTYGNANYFEVRCENLFVSGASTPVVKISDNTNAQLKSPEEATGGYIDVLADCNVGFLHVEVISGNGLSNGFDIATSNGHQTCLLGLQGGTTNTHGYSCNQVLPSDAEWIFISCFDFPPEVQVPEFSTIGILLALLTVTIALGFFVFKKQQ